MFKKFLVTLALVALGSVGLAQNPQIVSTSPANNELNIPVNTQISVTFDVDMDVVTINDATFIVSARITGFHRGTIRYDNMTKTATFDLTDEFDVGDVVTVVLTTGIKSSQGFPLSNSYVCSFTTGVMGGFSKFVLDSVYSVASDPFSLITADLNNDGYPDLITANRSSHNISVLLNNGDGTFALAVDYKVGDYPFSVVAADLDRDDDMDLAIANTADYTISVLLNNGDGTFAMGPNFGGGGEPTDIIAVDLDADGDLDLTTVNTLSDNVVVFFNNGDGTFQSARFYAIGDASFSISANDLDNDGDIDLVAPNSADGSVSVLMNHGDGTFGPHVPYNVSQNRLFCAITADYNGDHYPDISVISDLNNTVYTLLNNGDGTFRNDSTYTVGMRPHFHNTANLDCDNDLDLVVANKNSDNLSVLMNKGDGTFTTQFTIETGNGPTAVIAADFDSDGDLDLANTNNSDGTVSIILNSNRIVPKKPVITNVTDVPNDQGKQVRVSWAKSSLDLFPGDSTVVEYSIWRRIDRLPKKMIMSANKKSVDCEIINHGDLIIKQQNKVITLVNNTLPPGEWDFIVTVPAIGSKTYNVIATTLADSTIINGMYWSVFAVIAHTANPLIFFVSEPDSGYSLDNLIPHAPAGLLATAGDSTINLTWDMISDEDFNYYAIYRHTQSGLDTTTLEPYATTTDTLFTDIEVNANIQYYYLVSAVDFSGNEGEFSNEVSVIISGVNNHATVPKSFALFQNFPNPFNPTTTFAYQLPKTEHVILKIYNTLGQDVATIINKKQAPGKYEIKWDASNFESGIYLYRFRAGNFIENKKCILLK